MIRKDRIRIGSTLMVGGLLIVSLVFMFRDILQFNMDWARHDTAGSKNYYDLLRRVPKDIGKVQVWGADGDFRPAIVSRVSERVVLEAWPGGRHCEVHFGLRVDATWSTVPEGSRAAIVFRLLHKLGTEEVVVFEETVDLAAASSQSWMDRHVSVDAPEGLPAILVLETRWSSDSSPSDSERAKRASGGPKIAWGAPYVRCESSEILSKSASRVEEIRPNIILISVDTLRTDHLGLYGYWRRTTPVLDELAQDAIVFDQAFAVSPWTLPSHASMLTGLYPEDHRAGSPSPADTLSPNLTTLAEWLRRAGYRTLAQTAGGLMGKRSGLDRGFDEYRSYTRANLRSLMPSIFEDLAADTSKPFFLLLHTYDTHGPYIQPPEERIFRSSNRDPNVGPSEWSRILSIEMHDYQRFSRFHDLSDVVAAYDSGVHFVDGELGLFFDLLKASGLYESSLLIVTSDHGETFYDRATYVGHTYTLHDEIIRVPLLVRLPGGKTHLRSQELVSGVDITPMILDEAGLEIPSYLPGSNPLRRIRKELPPRQFVRGEASHSGSQFVRSQNLKVITGSDLANRDQAHRVPPGLLDRFQIGAQWYDLASDPSEMRNLIWRLDQNDERFEELAGELSRMLEREAARTSDDGLGETSEITPMSEDEIRELRSLGYVE